MTHRRPHRPRQRHNPIVIIDVIYGWRYLIELHEELADMGAHQ
jgi:hypothetical protein